MKPIQQLILAVLTLISSLPVLASYGIYVGKNLTADGSVLIGAHLRQELPQPDFLTLWVAPIGSVTAPFVPYWLANSDVLPEYRKHRYLTKGEATRFVTPDFSIQEASLFAGRLFKRLMYYTCDAPERFLPEVIETLTAFENESLRQVTDIEERAQELYDAGRPSLARAVMNDYSLVRAEEALELGEALLGSIELRHRLLEGYREPADWQTISTRHGERCSASDSPGGRAKARGLSVFCWCRYPFCSRLYNSGS